MTERGPVLRRGFITDKITPIGTTAGGTGLPTESTTTSFSKQAAVIFDGHDSLSGYVGLKTSGFSLAGGSSQTVSYQSPATIPSGTTITSAPSNTTITNNTPGTSLPTPSGITIYYKMTGFYTTGSVYESFVVTGNPTTATTVNPNTGHTLINTFVSQTWTS
jgi:hypothetical protein